MPAACALEGPFRLGKKGNLNNSGKHNRIFPVSYECFILVLKAGLRSCHLPCLLPKGNIFSEGKGAILRIVTKTRRTIIESEKGRKTLTQRRKWKARSESFLKKSYLGISFWKIVIFSANLCVFKFLFFSPCLPFLVEREKGKTKTKRSFAGEIINYNKRHQDLRIERGEKITYEVKKGKW